MPIIRPFCVLRHPHIIVGVGVPQNVREKRGSKNAVFRGKRQEKRPEIFEISGLGGDKRDRTADLLNAIGF